MAVGDYASAEALVPPQGSNKASRTKDMQLCLSASKDRRIVDEDEKLLLEGRSTTGFLWHGSLAGPRLVAPREDGAVIPADSLLNAFRSGDETNRYVLCLLYRGYRWEKAFASPLDAMRSEAEKGNVLAQSLLGTMYYYGRGTKQNINEAIAWYRKAADQGSAKSQFNLAMAYWEGNGVPKDNAQTLNWMRKAAVQNYPQAREIVARMEREGLGTKPKQFDSSEVERNRKAAEAGDKDAQFTVGWYYEDGVGVNQDISQAIDWYRKAAEAGHVLAQLQLGIIHDYARGGAQQDDEEAVKWYRRAAEGGNAQAQYNVGVMYELGRGVEKNEAESDNWIRKAIANGYKTRR